MAMGGIMRLGFSRQLVLIWFAFLGFCGASAPIHLAAQANSSNIRSDADSRFNRATDLLVAGKKKESLQVVDSILRQYPEHLASIMLKIQLLEEGDDYLSAQPYYEKALQLAPADPQILYLFGCHWLHRNEWRKAIQFLGRSRLLRPNHLETQFYLAQAYHLNGDEPSALIAIRECSTMAPDNDAICQKMGELLCAAQQYQEGLKWLLKAERLNPNLEKINLQIGMAYYNILEVPQAIAYLEKELSRTPHDPHAPLVLAQAYTKAANWEKAATFFTVTLKRQPDDPQVLLGLGRAQVGLKDYATALVTLQRALQLDPTLIEAHFQLGRAYRELGKREESLHELSLHRTLKDREATDSSIPKFRTAQDEQIWSECRKLLEKNQEAAVLALLKQALGDEGSNPAILSMNLGVIYASMGRPEEAKRALAEAVKIDPDLAHVHSHLGLIHISLGEYEQAERAFQIELKRFPTEQLALAGMGQLKHRQGKWSESAEYLEKCGTTDPLILWMLCDCYFHLGKTAQARLMAEGAASFAQPGDGVLDSVLTLLESRNERELAEKIRAKQAVHK
jgi:tetratricopeptide (TPR) repeat protein